MILVTGGTGFIGRKLVEQLLERGYPVRLLLRPSKTSPNLPKGKSVDAVICGLNDERGLRGALKGIEVIYHLASAAQQGTFGDLNQVDVAGTRTLVKAAREANVRKIVFISHLGADRASAFPVLKAKGLAEGFVQQSGLDYTIFRTCAVFGEGDHFTTPIARLLRRFPFLFILPGEGETLLQPLWVGDLIACLLEALDNPEHKDRLYSIGGGEFVGFAEAVQTIRRSVRNPSLVLSLSPGFLRLLLLWLEQIIHPLGFSIYWVDTLAEDRTCGLDSLPRLFGILPERFHTNLNYLSKVHRERI